jgi:hypothetical protein
VTGEERHSQGGGGKQDEFSFAGKQGFMKKIPRKGQPDNGLKFLEMAGIAEGDQVSGELKSKSAENRLEAVHPEPAKESIHKGAGKDIVKDILKIENQGKIRDEKKPGRGIKGAEGKGTDKGNPGIKIRHPADQGAVPHLTPSEKEHDIVMENRIEAIEKNAGL